MISIAAAEVFGGLLVLGLAVALLCADTDYGLIGAGLIVGYLSNWCARAAWKKYL